MAHFPPESVSSLVFFTKKEVALQLRITERTLFNIMAAGEITWVRVGSQASRVSRKRTKTEGEKAGIPGCSANADGAVG
jgi:hypothetical protein